MIADRHLRGIGWAALLAIAGALLFALSLRVNALKSEVRRTERQLVALRQERLYLETEFETRANQQQLESWNDVDFGYVSPGPGQYLDNVRELAALGKAAAPPVAAEPIRVAAATTAPPRIPGLVAPPVPARQATAPTRAVPVARATGRADPAVAAGDRPDRVDKAPRSAPGAKAAETEGGR